MSRYVLELKTFDINFDPNNSSYALPNLAVGSHYYWAIKDTQTGDYEYTFHGGAETSPGSGVIAVTGLPTQNVIYQNTPKIEDFGGDPRGHAGVEVMGFDSLDGVDLIVKLMDAVGSDINALKVTYGVIGDNSNSVAFLLGKALGLSDGQMQGLDKALQAKDGSIAGGTGFEGDITDGGTKLNVEGFIANAKAKGSFNEEEQAKLDELETQLEKIEEFNQTQAEALGSQLGSSFGRITYAFFGQEEGQTVLEEVIGESLSALISQNLFEFILTDADAFNDLLSNDLSAQLQSTISSRLTSELIAEIGIENGGSLPEAVALNVLNSVVNQGINYAIDAGISAIEGIWHSVEAAKQANDGAQAANTASDASNGSSITNGIGSAVGSWAASQVLHTNTEAEAYSSALGWADNRFEYRSLRAA